MLFFQQHGFRTNHSCETALHLILDNWMCACSQKKVNLALFIDFKKAFDLINTRLLFLKLFDYGFDNNSLALLTDYFKFQINNKSKFFVAHFSFRLQINLKLKYLLSVFIFLKNIRIFQLTF